MPSSRAHVLVTGGAGYIGSHTCKALAAAGYTPIVLDDLSTGHEWAVKWGPLEVSDIADRARVAKVIKQFDIDAVIHFAAHAYVGESIRVPQKYFDNNVVKTLALLDTLLEAGVTKFVFSSSCATYGLPRELPIVEDHPQQPVNPYGELKLIVERILYWYQHAYGLRHVNLRYFNAAGADLDGEIGEEHAPETHLIPLVIAAAQGTGPAVEIFGTDYDTPDRTAVRDYVHVCDLANAHVSALDYLLAGGQSASVNLGTGRGHSISRGYFCCGGHRQDERPSYRRPTPAWGSTRTHRRSATCGSAPGLAAMSFGLGTHRADRLGLASESPREPGAWRFAQSRLKLGMSPLR